MNLTEQNISQAQFSPQGNYYAINTKNYGVLLYDFDTETGLLSNFRQIPYPNSEDFAKGLCFSPNERFIYVTTERDVYQIDIQEESEIYHLGRFRSFDESGWPVGLGMIYQGPDCRLYVDPGSTTYYLHVIMEPDKKGAACNFAERGIELPARIGHDFPNIPQYRYLNGCDESITLPFVVTALDNSVISKKGLRLYPNPTKDFLQINSNKTIKNYTVYNLYGLQQDINYGPGQEIDISQLIPGTYFIKVESEDGMIMAEKFIKME